MSTATDEQADRENSEPKHRSAAYELKAAIMLREIEGMSYEDIAKMIICPIGAVRSHIVGTRKAITEELRPLLDIAKKR